ncbi:Endoplasmic reticulum oxidoreductin-1 [Glycine soja]
MADVMVTKEIEDTALRLGVNLSTLDLDAIRLPPGEDCGLLSHLFLGLQPLEQLEMVRDPLDLRRYAKTKDGDDLTQALVKEIIEKCLGFEVEQRSLVASYYLEQAEYDTGNPNEDLTTQSLIKQLLYNPKLQAACPIPFDEANLWKCQSGPELKQKIQQ